MKRLNVVSTVLLIGRSSSCAGLCEAMSFSLLMASIFKKDYTRRRAGVRRSLTCL